MGGRAAPGRSGAEPWTLNQVGSRLWARNQGCVYVLAYERGVREQEKERVEGAGRCSGRRAWRASTERVPG